MGTTLANINLDAALAEARERFIAANPASLAAHVEATAVMPGGNTRSVLFHTPFPLAMARGDGCRLWDADGHEYVDMLGEFSAGPVWPQQPGDPRGAGRGARCRVEPGRTRRDGGTAGATARGPVPVARPSAVHQFRDRGEPDGDRDRHRRDRAAAGDGVRRRVSRRHPVFRGRRGAGQRAAPVGDGPLQRRGRGAGAGAGACGRPGLHPGRADARQRRLHPGRARLPAGAARRRDRNRGRPGVRRGHDQPHVGRRAAGAPRDHAGHDDARQIRPAAA